MSVAEPDISLGVCVADDVVLTKDDVKEIRALYAHPKPTLGGGLRVLRTPETFPDLFTSDVNDKTKTFVNPDGRKFRPSIVDPNTGARKSDDSRWYKRGKERYFVGSTRWPDGLVIGMTYIETRDVGGGSKYTFTDAVPDVSRSEIDRLKDLARGDESFTEIQKVARHRVREAQRAKTAEANLDPQAQMAGAAAAAVQTVMQMNAAKPTASGPSAEELAKAGLKWDGAKLVKSA